MEFYNLSAPSLLPSLSPFTRPPSTFTTALGSLAPCLPTSSPKLLVALATVLSVELVLGLVGNSLALLVFCAYLRPWSSDVVLLVSLVAADFLLIVNLPLRVDYYRLQETWRFGDAACKVNLFLIATNRTASVVFLTATALHRCLKVARPHHALSRASGRAAARVAAGLWAGILLLNVHVFQIASPGRACLSYQLDAGSSAPILWHRALYLLEFFLSLALLLFAALRIRRTLRRRGLGCQAGPRRAVRALAAMVAIHTVCFLPSVLFGLASIVAFQLRACPALHICSNLFHGSLAVTYLNSVLDPVLYCFSSPKFLRRCRALLGLVQASQGPARDDSFHRPRGRLPDSRGHRGASCRQRAH